MLAAEDPVHGIVSIDLFTSRTGTNGFTQLSKSHVDYRVPEIFNPPRQIFRHNCQSEVYHGKQHTWLRAGNWQVQEEPSRQHAHLHSGNSSSCRPPVPDGHHCHSPPRAALNTVTVTPNSSTQSVSRTDFSPCCSSPASPAF